MIVTMLRLQFTGHRYDIIHNLTKHPHNSYSDLSTSRYQVSVVIPALLVSCFMEFLVTPGWRNECQFIPLTMSHMPGDGNWFHVTLIDDTHYTFQSFLQETPEKTWSNRDISISCRELPSQSLINCMILFCVCINYCMWIERKSLGYV